MVFDVSIEGIKARVKELLASMVGDLEPGDIPDDLPLFDVEREADGLELDSLDGLQLAVALANEYDLDPAVEMDYSRLRTVQDIAEHLQSLIASGGPP